MPVNHWHIQLDGLHRKQALDLPTRGVTVIFGASGAGKTSLLRALAGLDRRPGNIHFNDQCWQSAQVFLTPKQRNLAMAFQEPRLLPHKTARTNIFIGNTENTKIAANNIFAQLDLDSLLDQTAEKLSGGEQHRVALARALLQPSQALMLDEPLTGLDQQRRRVAVDLIKNAAKEKPVLLVTHQLDELLALADHLVLMDRCESVTGRLDELLNHPILIQQRGHEFSILSAQRVGGDEHTISLDLGEGQLLKLVGTSSAKLQRLAIDARDVSICLSKATDSSILNILPATVTHINASVDGACAVTLNLSGQTLRALVSDYSAKLLKLEAGKKVFAQIKGTIALAEQ